MDAGVLKYRLLRGWNPMQCFICGEPMRVVLVEPHQIDMPGFELRTFQCVGCGDVEKRPVFDSEHSRHVPAAAMVPETAADVAAEPVASSAPAEATPSRKKSLFGGFVKLRGNK
jgi:hypothetical protein